MTVRALIFRLLVLTLGLAAVPAYAGQRLEARFYPNPHLQLQSQWLEPVLRRGLDLERASTLIATSPYTELQMIIPPAFVGKRVRILLVAPAQIRGITDCRGLEMEWKTQGTYLPGRARPGDRVLLYQGTVTSAVLRDMITFTYQINADYVDGPISVEPIYEIEEN
jgi:hypothetical protein